MDAAYIMYIRHVLTRQYCKYINVTKLGTVSNHPFRFGKLMIINNLRMGDVFFCNEISLH
jgi:hypothetical protein